MRLLIILGVVVLAVGGAAFAFMSGGSGSDPGSAARNTPEVVTPPSNDSEAAPTSPALPGTTETIRDLDILESSSDDSVPQFRVGPYQVGRISTGTQPRPVGQHRAFRASDGTLAVLMHRPGGPQNAFDEILLTSSHDGGQTWQKLITLGLETSEASYSGAMDTAGNLFVVYGRYGEGRLAGGIKLRKLSFDADSHIWISGEEHQILWDWQGQGITDPILTFTKDRLWMVYGFQKVVRITNTEYSVLARYADKDILGDYPPEAWSEPIVLVPPSSDPTPSISVVAHGGKLSVLYSSGQEKILWRTLRFPLHDPESWSDKKIIMETPARGQSVKFTARAGQDDRIHMTLGIEGVVVAYMSFDGEKWSRLRQLDQAGVDWSVVGDTEDSLWTFWQKQDKDQAARIFVKPWTEDAGWRIKPSLLYVGLEDGTRPVENTFSRPVEIISGQTNGEVAVIWAESSENGEDSILWFESLALDPIKEVAIQADLAGLQSEPAPQLSPEVINATQEHVKPLPPGSFRQYTRVSLDIGKKHEFQLLDGQVRYIEVLDTETIFRTRTGVTVWVMVTIEVSGPGLEPQRATVPAAYFQNPLVLNGVRIAIEITKAFNDARLRDGGGTNNDVRLMLNDARYSFTEVDKYAWPFPGRLWGIGWQSTFYQGLQGTFPDILHHGAYDQGMPLGSSLHAWFKGTLDVTWRQFDWSVSIEDPDDGYNRRWHTVIHLDDGLALDKYGGKIQLGDYLGPVLGTPNFSHVHWGAGSFYDAALVLAEWYVAHATPAERSYVKDWLVLGPYENLDDETRLEEPYIPNEATVLPKLGEVVENGTKTWRSYDSIVPGVVDVSETMDPYPRSGWAKVTGNHPFSVAYMATYVFSPSGRDVILNFGSSDAIKVWVGDQIVLREDKVVIVASDADSTIRPDSYKVRHKLDRGWTRVLVKLAQGTNTFSPAQHTQEAWQFTFRISDEEGNPIDGLVISPDKNAFFNPLKHFVLSTPRAVDDPEPVADNQNTTAVDQPKQVGLTVDAQKEIHPFGAQNRGLNTRLQNWSTDALSDADSRFKPVLNEISKSLDPGIVRLTAGRNIAGFGWDRNASSEFNAPPAWIDPESGESYSYLRALIPSTIDRYASWVTELGADTIVQVNICDNNPEMWADLVRYANVDNNYGFKYWELGGGLQPHGSSETIQACLGVQLSDGPAELASRYVAYSEAMKAVDNSINMIGPSMAQPTAESSWMKPFVDEVGNLGGNVDVLSWYWYQLTAKSENPGSPAYEAGSLEAFLEYDRIVGESCLTQGGRELCAGDRIPDDIMSLKTLRRSVAETMMSRVEANYGDESSGMLSAMTQYGPHALLDDAPVNSNFIGALWLADMMPRWAYNGLDIAIFDSLEGDLGEFDSRGLIELVDAPEDADDAADPQEEDVPDVFVRPSYMTMLMYSKVFGDVLVASSTTDPEQKVVGWASKDSSNPDRLYLMLVNLSDEKTAIDIAIEGMSPSTGFAFEMSSRDPFAESDDDDTTRVNGVDIPDISLEGIEPFLRKLDSIPAKKIDVSDTFTYEIRPYSLTAIVLSEDAEMEAPRLLDGAYSGGGQ